MPTKAMVAPNGFWIKTHFYRDGNTLKAKSFMVVSGEPVVFEIGVNLAVIERAVRAYHQRMHEKSEAYQVSGCVGCDPTVGGIFGSIAKAVKKVGKSKLVKSVASAAKSIVKSKVVGKITAGLAVVYPPIGAPAAAAYAAANKALSVIDRGNAVRKAATAITAKAKATGKPVQLTATVKKALARQVALQKKAKAQINTLVTTAKYSDDAKKKAEAQKMVAVLNVAAKTRAQTKALPGVAARTSPTARVLIRKPTAVATGLIVTDRGNIVRGRFNEMPTGNPNGVLYRPGKGLPGNWQKVSGDCVGCKNPFPNLRY